MTGCFICQWDKERVLSWALFLEDSLFGDSVTPRHRAGPGNSVCSRLGTRPFTLTPALAQVFPRGRASGIPRAAVSMTALRPGPDHALLGWWGTWVLSKPSGPFPDVGGQVRQGAHHLQVPEHPIQEELQRRAVGGPQPPAPTSCRPGLSCCPPAWWSHRCPSLSWHHQST